MVDTNNLPGGAFDNQLDDPDEQVTNLMAIMCSDIQYTCIYIAGSRMISYLELQSLRMDGSVARKQSPPLSSCVVCVCVCVCSFSRLIAGLNEEPIDFNLDGDYFFLFGFGDTQGSEPITPPSPYTRTLAYAHTHTYRYTLTYMYTYRYIHTHIHIPVYTHSHTHTQCQVMEDLHVWNHIGLMEFSGLSFWDNSTQYKTKVNCRCPPLALVISLTV